MSALRLDALATNSRVCDQLAGALHRNFQASGHRLWFKCMLLRMRPLQDALHEQLQAMRSHQLDGDVRNGHQTATPHRCQLFDAVPTNNQRKPLIERKSRAVVASGPLFAGCTDVFDDDRSEEAANVRRLSAEFERQRRGRQIAAQLAVDAVPVLVLEDFD